MSTQGGNALARQARFGWLSQDKHRNISSRSSATLKAHLGFEDIRAVSMTKCLRSGILSAVGMR